MHDLSYNDVKGDIFKAAKRTKAQGLFLDNNPSFLFQYRAGMRMVKNLAWRAEGERRRYNYESGQMGLNDVE